MESLQPDVAVLGPHRRKILQDVFVGTTAERAIRLGSVPFIMANEVPSKSYARILLATDFSSCATDATRKVQELNLTEGKKTFLLHVYDTPAESLLYRASMTLEESKRYLAQERADAEREIAKFVRINGLTRVETVLKVLDTTYVDEILRCADEKDVDLIVIGSRSLNRLQKIMLSSVAEGLLRTSHLDVLAVPSH